MRRRVLLASLSPLALSGLVALVALTLAPAATLRLATQLGASLLATVRGVASFLRRAAPLSTLLFTAFAWVIAGGFGVFFPRRDAAGARTTAELSFALLFSAGLPLVVVFARNRPGVVTAVVVAVLSAGGAVLAGRSRTARPLTGVGYALAPVVLAVVAGSVLLGGDVTRAATLVLPVAGGYLLGVAAARGRYSLGAVLAGVVFAVPAWTYFPPAAEATVRVGPLVLAVGFALVAAALAVPFGVVGYASRRASSGRRAPLQSRGDDG